MRQFFLLIFHQGLRLHSHFLLIQKKIENRTLNIQTEINIFIAAIYRFFLYNLNEENEHTKTVI